MLNEWLCSWLILSSWFDKDKYTKEGQIKCNQAVQRLLGKLENAPRHYGHGNIRFLIITTTIIIITIITIMRMKKD